MVCTAWRVGVGGVHSLGWVGVSGNGVNSFGVGGSKWGLCTAWGECGWCAQPGGVVMHNLKGR